MKIKDELIGYLNHQFNIYLNDIGQKYKAYIGILTEEDRHNMQYPFVIEKEDDDMVLAISVTYNRCRKNPQGITVEAKSLINKMDLQEDLNDTLENIEEKVIRSLIIALRRHVKSENT